VLHPSLHRSTPFPNHCDFFSVAASIC
jgi:hypothetical protein